MGGKGKRRREKNYLAAHGGPTRLPPPPDHSKLDALPSKLRRLISFASLSPHDSAKDVEEKKQKDKKARVDSATGVKSGSERRSEGTVVEERKTEGHTNSSDHENGGDQTLLKSGDEKKKKKRKRDQIKDLRFEKELAELEGRSRRRERKKKYWEAKKKKNKKGKTEETVVDFPKHEKIRFGEVVEAPPKLVVVPKAPKSAQSASKERQRLLAVEAYRARKGWTSRPGLQFPSIAIQPDGA
ncbi:PREDICTED: protein PXR1 [Tarenaya hassleriana]|uniref:protein PXR1 n=1 Tax=Tarenaya hassleriana TaxID=28532 RepID=UPI00053C477F|nr:PREDICTED: protein PXR1 [Tarenaya hassleriana]